MSLRSCEHRSKYLNLFKGVSADISVVELNFDSVWKYFYETEKSKTITMPFLVLILPDWYQGVITMEEERVTLTL